MQGRLLIVEDDEASRNLFVKDFSRRGFSVEAVSSVDEALLAVEQKEFEAILTDINMPRRSGIELCKELSTRRPELPVVVITAFGSMETAIKALRAGAFDFVTRPVELEIVALTMERAVDHAKLHATVKRLSDVDGRVGICGDLIGDSPQMKKVYSQIERVADSDTTILVTGESGTGKELVARALHGKSSRSNKPLVTVNCAAIPENLIEAELFGYVKGSFTGANADHKGLFLEADGGTLFLDEIGELPMTLQAKLLRALEERKVRPIGSTQDKPVDVRLISATNRDLDTAVAEKRFREDLLYRLDVIRIEIPPLRNRGKDVIVLAKHFLDIFALQQEKEVAFLPEPFAKVLLDYDWPGNVRELKNAMERTVVLAQREAVDICDLPSRIQSYHPAQMLFNTGNPDDIIPLEELEKRYISYVLEAVNGNKSLAARLLKLDRKTLYRKLDGENF